MNEGSWRFSRRELTNGLHRLLLTALIKPESQHPTMPQTGCLTIYLLSRSSSSCYSRWPIPYMLHLLSKIPTIPPVLHIRNGIMLPISSISSILDTGGEESGKCTASYITIVLRSIHTHIRRSARTAGISMRNANTKRSRHIYSAQETDSHVNSNR